MVGTAFGTAWLVELALSADGALLFRSVRPFHHWRDTKFESTEIAEFSSISAGCARAMLYLFTPIFSSFRPFCCLEMAPRRHWRRSLTEINLRLLDSGAGFGAAA